MQQESEDTAERERGSEDTEREFWLKQIALASLKAADRILSIQQVCYPASLTAAHVLRCTCFLCARSISLLSWNS